MYKVGMYGGSFDPLHIGHINNIIKASSMCEELFVIISFSDDRDFIRKELRYRWILNSTKHIGNIKIFLLEDNALSKDDYDNGSYWEEGARTIKNMISKPIDIVFCGSDYKGTNRFENLYKESKVYYFERSEIDISSTLIRNNPLKYWDYLPHISKSFFTKKILIVGGESTGKSTLVQNLALFYNTNFVSEVGRDTCEYAGSEDLMIEDDLIENLLKQRINVDEAVKYSNKLLFVDTDSLTTQFYLSFLFGEDNENYKKLLHLSDAINNINYWDLILFLEPTVSFVQDGTRSEEIASNRELYSNQIKELFDKKQNANIKFISGDYLNRFEESKKIINSLFF